MPTPKQEKLATAIVENLNADIPKTKGELLEIAGYDKTTAMSSPGRTIEQQGVKDALIAKGFTIDKADDTVNEIMVKGEEHNRLKAADMVYKRLGGYAPDKSISLNVNAEITDEVVDKLAELIKERNGIYESTTIRSNGESADKVDREVSD